MHRNEIGCQKEYDVTLLASTYKESEQELIDFIAYHHHFLAKCKLKTALALVFESNEGQKAKSIKQEVTRLGFAEYLIVTVNIEGKGFSSCLNYAIRNINSRYFMRIDTDDRSLSNRIPLQMGIMEKLNIDLCYGWMIDEAGKTLKYPSTPIGAWSAIGVGQNPIPHPTVCFKRSAIVKVGLYNDKLTRAEDFELWIRLLRCREITIHCIKEPLVFYHTERAVEKNHENAKTQIRIRLSMCCISLDSVALLSGAFFNLARLMLPSNILLQIRRSL